MTIGEIIADCLRQGTLTEAGVGAIPSGHFDHDVYHHEWAKDADDHLVCVILAGCGHYYFHDLDAKTFFGGEPGGYSSTLKFIDL